MFAEEASAFGREFGGIQTVEACSRAPKFPIRGQPPVGEPSLRGLCRRSFLQGARNGDITKIERIACPSQLYQLTGLRLADDSTFTKREKGFNGYTTTTMDCCKPAAGFAFLADGSPRYQADPRYPFVRACRSDGYTRV